MDTIKIAELLSGFQKVDDENINSVYRGHIQPESSDEPLLAYFKIIPPREILVEAICSLIAKQLNLPTPEPYLLIMSETVCPIDGNHNIPAFATVDARSPSFRQYLRHEKLQIEAIVDLLKKWAKLIHSATFDEFIGNTDRNVGNLLYDGKDITLIDHGLAISQTHLASKPNAQNLLFSLVQNDNEHPRARYKKIAYTELSAYADIPFNLLASKTFAADYLDDATINEVINFLRERIGFMTDHIAYQLKFPIYQQVLR